MVSAQPLLAKGKPGVDAVAAAKLATEYLANLGSEAPYIVSITMDQGGIIKGSSSWVVRWSSAIKSENQVEVGVRVKSDGTVVRLVEGKGGAAPHSTRPPAALEIR